MVSELSISGWPTPLLLGLWPGQDIKKEESCNDTHLITARKERQREKMVRKYDIPINMIYLGIAS